MAILTPVSDSELAEFLSAYPLGALLGSRGIEAGTVNTSYSVDLEAGRYFVRLYEEQDAPGAARESRVLTHLASRGVPTPAPVLAVNGSAAGLATGTLAGKPAAVFPWVEGEMLCQAAVIARPTTAEAVGAALARIHLAGHAPDAPLDEGRFSPSALVTRCERIRTSTDSAARGFADDFRAAAEAVVQQRRHDVPRGLIHGDLFRDNVLWQDASMPDRCSIAALLDFESAHDGPFAYDLAVTILSWAFGSSFDADVASAIVRGYRSVRELEPEDRAVLWDEARFAALRFAITRITDDAIRVGKRWQRFIERREVLGHMGPRRFAEILGL